MLRLTNLPAVVRRDSITSALCRSLPVLNIGIIASCWRVTS